MQWPWQYRKTLEARLSHLEEQLQSVHEDVAGLGLWIMAQEESVPPEPAMEEPMMQEEATQDPETAIPPLDAEGEGGESFGEGLAGSKQADLESASWINPLEDLEDPPTASDPWADRRTWLSERLIHRSPGVEHLGEARGTILEGDILFPPIARPFHVAGGESEEANRALIQTALVDPRPNDSYDFVWCPTCQAPQRWEGLVQAPSLWLIMGCGHGQYVYGPVPMGVPYIMHGNNALMGMGGQSTVCWWWLPEDQVEYVGSMVNPDTPDHMSAEWPHIAALTDTAVPSMRKTPEEAKAWIARRDQFTQSVRVLSGVPRLDQFDVLRP